MGLKEGWVECATVFIKSEVILTHRSECRLCSFNLLSNSFESRICQLQRLVQCGHYQVSIKLVARLIETWEYVSREKNHRLTMHSFILTWNAMLYTSSTLESIHWPLSWSASTLDTLIYVPGGSFFHCSDCFVNKGLPVDFPLMDINISNCLTGASVAS